MQWYEKNHSGGAGPESTSELQETHTPIAPSPAALLVLSQLTLRSLCRVPNNQLTKEEKNPGACFAGDAVRYAGTSWKFTAMVSQPHSGVTLMGPKEGKSSWEAKLGTVHLVDLL